MLRCPIGRRRQVALLIFLATPAGAGRAAAQHRLFGAQLAQGEVAAVVHERLLGMLVQGLGRQVEQLEVVLLQLVRALERVA